MTTNPFPLYAPGPNSVYVLQRGHQVFMTRAFGGGPAVLLDKGSFVVVDSSFPVTTGMHFIGPTNQSPSVQLGPA